MGEATLYSFFTSRKRVSTWFNGVEYPLQYNGMNKRADIICFQKKGKPMLLVECKSANVSISQKVFDQIARYNFDLKGAIFGGDKWFATFLLRDEL